MNTRRIILIVALVSLLAGTAVLLCRPSHGPKYEGKSLEAWFREFCISHPALDVPNRSHEPSVRALRALGTNAVPYLLEQCFSQAQDSAFETNIFAPLSNRVLVRLGAPPFMSASYLQWSAGEALREIKPPAPLILPSITNALGGTNTFQRQKALFLLGAIGEGAAEATPWLAQGVHSAIPLERFEALNSIERLGPAVTGVLPDLMTLLTNKSTPQGLQRWACRDLRSLGSNALPAAPFLRALLQSETNPAVSSGLLTTLCRIDAQAEELHTFLAKIQRETNEAVLDKEVSMLWQIGPNAKPAIPVLLKLLREDHTLLWETVVGTLKQIGATKAEVMPLLTERMQEQNPTTRYYFANATRWFDPGNPAAVAILLKIIQTEPNLRLAATGALDWLGPEAKAALPLLREAAASPDKTVSEIARRTLRNIERSRPAN